MYSILQNVLKLTAMEECIRKQVGTSPEKAAGVKDCSQSRNTLRPIALKLLRPCRDQALHFFPGKNARSKIPASRCRRTRRPPLVGVGESDDHRRDVVHHPLLLHQPPLEGLVHQLHHTNNRPERRDPESPQEQGARRSTKVTVHLARGR